MKISAKIDFQCDSIEELNIIHQCFLPVLNSTSMKRSNWEMITQKENSNPIISFLIKSEDLVAFRATNTLIFHMIHIIEQVQQIF